MEKPGCKIICGAPTTLALKELIVMMMQPYPSQSLNPQIEAEHEGQEAEPAWISQRVLSLVVISRIVRTSL